ncbi:MAG: AAA family ATPase [Saprospirales bacterium]|nr:AAA family ATPase [Saprospirales bacterium]
MLILITGLPGAGKSTFALALAAANGAVHLNTDRVRAKLGLRGHYDPESKQKSIPACSTCWNPISWQGKMRLSMPRFISKRSGRHSSTWPSNTKPPSNGLRSAPKSPLFENGWKINALLAKPISRFISN